MKQTLRNEDGAISGNRN